MSGVFREIAVVLVIAAAATLAGLASGQYAALQRSRAAVESYALGLEAALALDPVWVDAREANAGASPVADAIRLPPGAWGEELFRLLERWREPDPIVVFCEGAGCTASQEVAERLRRELDFDRVYFLKGGVDAWER